MPDLSKSAVEQWLVDNEPDRKRAFGEDGPAERSLAAVAALEKLGKALDEALALDPGLLAGRLGGDPIRAEFRAILAQVGLPRYLRIISWILNERLPRGTATLSGLLEHDRRGDGQYLQAVLIEANRPSLLASIYSIDRLATLQRACRDLDVKKEAA